MTFESFKKIIDLMVASSNQLSKSLEVGIDLIEFTDIYRSTIDQLWSNLLDENGIDWLEWFLYEKDYISNGIGNPEIKAYYQESGDEIVKDLNGLYDYLIENKYFICQNPK
jgi:hypothetical protein